MTERERDNAEEVAVEQVPIDRVWDAQGTPGRPIDKTDEPAHKSKPSELDERGAASD